VKKTSTKEWPSFLDIEGRAKLDAFEKYLQELPMSRSRSLMRFGDGDTSQICLDLEQ
ncbi:hypothetical protein MKW98_030473, partial [Papaver atlanticum]